jgi:glutaredoxin
LDAFGGSATYHDVQKDAARLEEMLKLSGGVRKVPVIVQGGRASIGFERGS